MGPLAVSPRWGQLSSQVLVKAVLQTGSPYPLAFGGNGGSDAVPKPLDLTP